MNFVFPEFKFNLAQTDLARDTKAKEEKAGFIKVHGQTEMASHETLMLCEVLVKDTVRLDRNIKSVRSLVAGEVIPNYQTVIAVFHNADNTKWRFTLVVKEFSGDHKTYDKKPDSYTYVFGVGEKGRTAAQRFYKLKDKPSKTLKDLEEAFSVEALSKDFFKEYKAVYQKFVDDIILVSSRLALFKENSKEKQEKAARDFVKKMMGRMVFLYFLQKKGWLGCKTYWQGGDEAFMKTFVEKAVQDDSFYFQYLEPLFFDTLNAKRTKQEEDCIIQKKNFGKVPYLNGGLFEKDDNHPNGLTLTWANFQTFFDTLNNYNFTIIEDDPEFKEVAVDPEMLGHIFENLLEDNKDKGAFYTPKEIVHYMCQESLYEYLKTYLQQNKHWPTAESEAQPVEKALQRFVKQKLAGGIIDYDKPLAKALKEVKICDPAIGSGAFPMGLLNEIYHCVHKLHDESPDKVGDVWGIGKTWQGNKVKLNIIQNSIYGVDIEKGAVDIARLRFWLSLIVDEPEPTPLPNLEYKIVVGNSLVSKLGDDIIDIDWNANDTSHGLFGAELAEKKKKLLERISAEQKESFNPESDKHKLAHDIRNLKIDLLINQLELMIKLANQDKEPKATSFKDKKKFALAQQVYGSVLGWKTQIKRLQGIKQKKGEYLDFFDWKLDFPEVMNEQLLDKPGFDIVIGNPPYIRQEAFADLKPFLKSKYKIYHSIADFLTYFVELSYNILAKQGSFSFIISNKFTRANYGQVMREFLISKTTLTNFIDFSGIAVFENATVDAAILGFRKEVLSDKNSFKYLNLDKTKITNVDLGAILTSQLKEYDQNNLGIDIWAFEKASVLEIKRKVESQGIPLKDLDVTINYGIKTGLNEAFVIDGEKRKELIKADPHSKEIIKRLLRGRDIQKFYPDYEDLWLVYVPWHFPLHTAQTINGVSAKAELQFKSTYPAIYTHLLQFKKELSARNKAETGIRYEWYALQRFGSNYWQDFDKPKIIYPNMTKYLPFVLDLNDHYYHNDKSFHLVGENIFWLCAFFNSKLFDYCFRDNFPELLGGTRELRKVFFEKIPVKKVSAQEEKPFKLILEKILALKAANKDTSTLENQLDVLVFKFYNLTLEEVKVVDHNFTLSKEEYNAIKIE